MPLFTLDLGGKVAFFDLVERADLGEFERTFSVAVPAHGARFFRLDAEHRRDAASVRESLAESR